MLSQIIVNLDTWTADTAENLHRCNGDADVAALSLLHYWCCDDTVLIAAINGVATDMTFDCKKLGIGSKLANQKMKMNDREEAKRNTAGMSGWRICTTLAQNLKSVEMENRHPTEKTPVARLVKAMEEDGVKMVGRNEDTLTRYISVGKRLDHASIKNKLMLWESFEQRGCLIDNLTVMRTLVSVCPDASTLEFVLHVLFLEQRAGLRADVVSKSNNEQRTPTNRMKAIILRNGLLLHLSESFPEFKELVLTYQTEAYIKATFNIHADGTRPDFFEPPQSDASDDDGADAGSSGVTSHASRPPLQRLCKDLATNQLERTLCTMCKEQESKVSVDLTVPAAKCIVARIEHIAFASRFPP